MKNLIWVSAILLLAVSTSFAFDPIGAPTNNLLPGQCSVGFDYSHSNMDIDIKGNQYFSHYGISGKLPKNFRINKYYGTVGYGVTENIGIFGRVGTASARSDLSVGGAPYAHVMTNYGHANAFGFGVRATVHKDTNVQWGVVAQCSWIRDLSVRRHIYSFQSASANIDLMEIEIAGGPTYQVRPWWIVYGGPLLHIVRGDFRGKGLCTSCGITSDVTHDIQQASWFGGFVGTQVQLKCGALVFVEYIHTAHGNGLGTGLVIPL